MAAQRLIGLDEAMEATRKEIYWTESRAADVRSFLLQQPRVDAVPVVRCKECKHYHAEQGWCDEHSSFIDERGVKCHPWESNDWRMFNEDDFCSYGERKEN